MPKCFILRSFSSSRFLFCTSGFFIFFIFAFLKINSRWKYTWVSHCDFSRSTYVIFVISSPLLTMVQCRNRKPRELFLSFCYKYSLLNNWKSRSKCCFVQSICFRRTLKNLRDKMIIWIRF